MATVQSLGARNDLVANYPGRQDRRIYSEVVTVRIACSGCLPRLSDSFQALTGPALRPVPPPGPWAP